MTPDDPLSPALTAALDALQFSSPLTPAWVAARLALETAIRAAVEEARRVQLEEAARHVETTECLIEISSPEETKRSYGTRVCRALAAELRALREAAAGGGGGETT